MVIGSFSYRREEIGKKESQRGIFLEKKATKKREKKAFKPRKNQILIKVKRKKAKIDLYSK